MRLRPVLTGSAIYLGVLGAGLGTAMALAAILFLYLVIGVVAAIGTVTISRARFSPRFEHIFFALLLIPIAAMYLAFVEYFGDHSALRLEVYGVALFAGLGLLGLRLPTLLIIGYALHGAWDLAHEAFLYLVPAPGDIRSVTAIPLAYGVFCAAYDWCMAGYFFTRQAAWRH
jgi:hypothetical protein